MNKKTSKTFGGLKINHYLCSRKRNNNNKINNNDYENTI